MPAGLAEDAIGNGGELRSPHREARFLESLALGAREDGLAILEMAAGKLPCALPVAAQPLANKEPTGGDVADHSADADAGAGVAGQGCCDAHSLVRLCLVAGARRGVVVVVICLWSARVTNAAELGRSHGEEDGQMAKCRKANDARDPADYMTSGGGGLPAKRFGQIVRVQ